MTELSGTSGTHSLAIVVTYFPDTAALLKLLGQLNKDCLLYTSDDADE